MIPVIDLFAGPGGLSEGFSALRDQHGERVFRIVLSIEKDSVAHKTLLLRSFFRKFEHPDIPEQYYTFLSGQLTMNELFALYPKEAAQAKSEALCAALGKHDSKDIGARISRALGKEKHWVLIGGPPCQAYSLVGRSRMLRKNPEKFKSDERHTLYREYLHILAAHRPPVFVMENVKGMLSSKVEEDRIITRILEDLRKPCSALPEHIKKSKTCSLEYELFPLAEYGARRKDVAGQCSPEDFLIKCEEHGIPQARHRVIILGIRSDVSKKVAKLRRQTQVSMWGALSDLPRLRSRLSKGGDSAEMWVKAIRSILDGKSVPSKGLDPKLNAKLKSTAKKLRKIRTVGSEYISWKKACEWKKTWFHDPRLGGVINHSARSHMSEDLKRYFFCACFARLHKRSPRLKDFPSALLPAHKNIKNLKTGIVFADRFRVQLQSKAATTITSHIGKDGHYFIHPDPLQCRSLTVREAARLQTFPDNYYFCGGRTEQYHQVGNAVPPLMALQIAKSIQKLFNSGHETKG